jgi:Mg-chelatase subunit ChlD
VKRILTYILLFFSARFAMAQAKDEQVWDFGDIAYWNNDTAWFKVKNASNKDFIFLPTHYKENVAIMFSSRLVEAGETVELGVVYYTEKKGKFTVDLPLYISTQPTPIHFTIKGNIKGFNPAAQIRCPVVNGGTEDNQQEKLIEIEVRDRETDKIIAPDELTVKNRENKKLRLESGGLIFRTVANPGAYRVSATKKGYLDYMAHIQLEPYQRRFIVYMDKNIDSINPAPVVTRINRLQVLRDSLARISFKRTGNRDEPRTSEDSTDFWLETHIPDPHNHSTIKRTDTVPAVTTKKDTTILDSKLYAQNNIIFILDVSMSMKRDGKLGSLKSAVGILIDALRTQDKLGIVGLSSQATLVQSPQAVSEKDSIKARLNRMKADGGTNGGAALKMAYALARTHFVEGGNNQIIIATDGVFGGGDLTRKEIEKLIATGNQEGIHLSTVAFGFDPKAILYLENLSTLGGGSNVRITQPQDSENALLNMIKNQSRR